MSRAAFAWLYAALALIAAPHIARNPPWVSALFLALAAWRAGGLWRGWPLPGPAHPRLTALKRAIAIGVFVAVGFAYGGSVGRDAGTALLLVLLGLKLLEAGNERDFFVAAFLGFFLVVTNLLYTQTMATAVHTLAAVALMTAALVAASDGDAALAPRRRLALAAVITAQAAPLMLVLFILFPRLPGPLWGLPGDAFRGVTGLTETLSFGDISTLGESDELAFRARFAGPRPPPAELYWRGPVLWFGDGRHWTVGLTRPQDSLPVPVLASGTAYRYTITLEPHNERWLPALDLPTHTPIYTRQARDLRLLTPRRVERRIRYDVTSNTRYRVIEASERDLSRALQLPYRRHPRAVALGRQWRAQLGDAEAVVAQAGRYFHDQPFIYTLQPPALPGDPVDDFLFGTRRGFCEHYAAAFTVLMRAAGIPTRIVTGYQGGDYNPVGDYLIVRQRDAHAWAEVWLGERGWVRVDPTAAVAPERVERGVDRALPLGTGLIPIDVAGNGALARALRDLRNRWDAVNYAWNQWVLGYGPQRQNQLLGGLGMRDTDWRRLGLWLAGTTCAILALIGAGMLWRRRRATDLASALYARFCDRLGRAGCPRLPWEGPYDYARRARAAFADLGPAIDAFTDLYVRVRYGGEPDASARLAAALRGVRVPRPLRRRMSR
ncbi:MAG: DUF3488 and DUF4129 domain-containing transglutaminase family protein [Gammaproteobacteria bacterium]